MFSIESLRGMCRQISLDEIKAATNNFHEDNVLRKSEEGKVYLAEIQLGWKKTQVAVKHLKPNYEEFLKEIRTISKIQHPNLVSLLGYCDESGEKFILTEYMEKGCLSDYVSKKSSVCLSWLQRLRICLDVARGLQHLHLETDEYPKGITHRDINPDNILLGKDWVAKISEFGVLKFSRAGQVNSAMITCLKGTYGMYAPEYVRYGYITRKTDVYAFGAVLFQLLCNKMPWDRGDDQSYSPTDDEDLGAWASQNVDAEISEEITDDSFMKFTAIIGESLRMNPDKRPTMDSVVSQLEKALKCQELPDEAARGRAASRYRVSNQHSTTADTDKVLKYKEMASRGACNRVSLDLIKQATNNFHEDNVLGKGGEGKVYLAIIQLDSKDSKVAVKHLEPNSTEFDKEINTMSEIKHDNIVSLLGYCDESGQKILIYEYMEKGSLFEYAKKSQRSSFNPLSWLQRLRICLDAARGLQHLHVPTKQYGKGIIHRDIKPANILLGEDWVAKISDFGLFKVSEAGQEESKMDTLKKGTSGYFAPEYHMYGQVTRKIDVYSFGVVMFQVLCLKMPWDRGDETYNMLKDEDLGIWAEKNIDPEIEADICDESLKIYAGIIGKCLKQDPDKRPTMNGVVWQLEIALKRQELRDEKVKKKGRAARESDHDHSTAGSHRGASRVSNAEVEYSKAVVLDIGGGITKAGFAGDDYPQAVFATCIGSPKNNEGSSRTRIGKDLASYKGEVMLRNLVKDGIVVDWAGYEEIIHHALYNELDCLLENKRPVLLTEHPLKHNATNGEREEYKTNREKMIKLMFEEFDVPSVYIGSHPVLSIFATGITTGLVIESGEDVSHSVPVYEGHVLPHAITSLRLAGRGITDHLMKILNQERGCSFSTRADRDIVKNMKENMAYVPLNYQAELEKSKKMMMTYALPDGKTICIGQELFHFPEALFDPSIVELDEPGIHKNMHESVLLCDEDIRDKLYGSIVVSGGSTMLSGIGERMEKEMRGLVPSGTNFKILAYPNRHWGAWIGGSIVAASDSFQKAWITKEDYDDYGPGVVHRKFF